MNFLSFSDIKDPYQAVLDDNWTDMEKHYSDTPDTLLCPISMNKDTAFHLAVHSGTKWPLDSLLQHVEESFEEWENVLMKNSYGNTVLHEAVISGNMEAVELLLDPKYEMLLTYTNEDDETPMFRAAAFGKTKILKHLARPDQLLLTDDGTVIVKHLSDIHRRRKDGASILHAAVQGEHFGTALELLELDEELADSKHHGETSLTMLTRIPSVLDGSLKMNILKRLVFLCLPVGHGHEDDAKSLEIPVRNGETNSWFWEFSNRIYLSIWRLIIEECSIVRKLWKRKRYHKFAYELASKLIKKDKSWEQSIMGFTATPTEAMEENDRSDTINEAMEENDRSEAMKKVEDNKAILKEEEDQSPLFSATKTGNAELVKMILKEHPQAIEYGNSSKQNILHVAVKYRQKEIFDLVTKKRIPLSRLVRQIMANGYTVLHSVAETADYPKDRTFSGPAYELQEELEWFSNVKKLVPSHYTTLTGGKKNITADKLFREKHDKQLEKAQKWIKETSQSCSGVAVLVATVVFAAAFTVPGGTDNKSGLPTLLHSPFFLIFTVMDVVSLSCSLTAVVLFLSVLTSPSEFRDFHVSLPRRLTLGFALLFMSVATTMLAFTSTIILIIRLDTRRQWTMTLICSAAFFPVSVLALTHFPLFVSFVSACKSLFILISMPFTCILRRLNFLGKSAPRDVDIPIQDPDPDLAM